MRRLCRTFEPHQMDFDHRDPPAKAFGLTTPTALGTSRERLLLEVAKCDVICAVCHRIRTRVQHQRRLRERPSSGSSQGLAQRRRRWTWHAQVLDELRQVACADCGGRFPPCAMDFDHREDRDFPRALSAPDGWNPTASVYRNCRGRQVGRRTRSKERVCRTAAGVLPVPLRLGHVADATSSKEADDDRDSNDVRSPGQARTGHSSAHGAGQRPHLVRDFGRECGGA